ncbi:MAG: DUF1425 domain-containing protein [Tepidisphaeraceae bacterium]
MADVTKFAALNLLAVVGLAAAGCHPQVKTARPEIDREDQFGIVLSQDPGDSDVRHDTAFGPERQQRDEFGLLHVSVPVRSQIKRTLYLEYQYSFFDAGGKKLEGPFGWTPVTLEAGSPGTIQFNSTNKNATLYQCVVRYAR